MEAKLKRQQMLAWICSIALYALVCGLVVTMVLRAVTTFANPSLAAFEHMLVQDWRGAASWALNGLNFLAVATVLLLLAGAVRVVARGGQAFCAGNVRRLKAMSAILAADMLLELLAGILIGFAAVQTNVSGVLVDYVSPYMDIGAAVLLLVAGGIYCVALMFEHGVLLQRQSDETL